MESFFRRQGATFEPTPSTRGPWDDRFQHGGPPCALLFNRMRAALDRDDFTVARFSAEFLRPVPIATLRVEVDAPTGGRRVQRMTARLVANEAVLSATALFIRETPGLGIEGTVRDGHTEPGWPAPETLHPFEFPFFTCEVGYHTAVDIRIIDEPWGTTPVRCWARAKYPLVDDDPLSPEEGVIIMADAESGIGPPVDPDDFSYLNPDLTVYFGRRPRPRWVGMEIRSRADGVGVGLSESALRDDGGVFGRSAQSLVLAKR